MRIVIGLTDNRWAAFLRDHPEVTEVNFWQPSPHAFKALREGEPFLFKTKDPAKFRGVDIPGYALVGGGFYQEYIDGLRVSEAWTIWGAGNGTRTEQELLAWIQAYRARRRLPYDPDPSIGCITLRNVFFANRGDELSQPRNWSRQIVTTKGYETIGAGREPDSEEVLQAFQLMQGNARVDPVWETDLRGVDLTWHGPKYGEPILVRPRMGQGRFRHAVDRAYSYRCAVTGSGTYPSLEAAHIRDYVHESGTHAVSNALLLRSDVHTLYDRGYLGIDPDLRLRVSPALRAHGWNGVEFYEREAAGFRIRVPDEPHLQPDRQALEWKFTKFRAA